MKALAWIFSAALVALAPLPVAAQEPQEGTVVEALVVQSIDHGPAWWRVRKGEATVYILGGPMAMLPKDLKWDEKTLERRINHSKSLIMPSAATIGLGDIFTLFRLRGQMKGDEPLER